MKRTSGRIVKRTTVLGLAAVLALAATPGVAQQITARPRLITAETEKAIQRGQAYLARTQSRDGSWREGGNYGRYPVTMTALGALGLMAGGNTPVEGKYASNVRRAVDYLIASQQEDGFINRAGQAGRGMYGHGFAMLFLAEAYGMEQDPTRQARLKRVLEKGVKLIAKSQSGAGGWYYSPNSGSDEGSVTITQVQGLRAARNAGINVPKDVIEKGIEYINKSANNDGGIAYRATSRGSSRPPITAAAVAVLYNAGEEDSPVAIRAMDYLDKLLKGSRNRLFGGHKFYSMLYLAQAKYLMVDVKRDNDKPVQTEKDWESFFASVRDDLLNTQQEDGGWQGDSVGTTYGTGIALVTLQLPYRYLPIMQR